MKTELAIYPRDGRIRCVLLENGRAAEVLDEPDCQTIGEKDILLGLVSRVEPRLHAAFVAIGDSQDAMLELGDAPASIKAGQTLVVQVKRLTDPGKGLKVSSHIVLPGPFAVFSPDKPPKRRSRLKLLDDTRADQLFEQDLRRLENAWQQVLDQSSIGPVPRRLLALSDPLITALTAWTGFGLDRIQVEGQPLYADVYELVSQLSPIDLSSLKLHVPDAGYGLAAVLGLSDLDEEIASRRVWLKSGAHLVFDATEALMVVDVNSGKSSRGKDARTMRRLTNLEAAEEIARQLRLRKTYGAILIDFLNMDQNEDREALLEHFRDATSRDRARIKLYGLTALGFLEMTRSLK